MLPHKGFLRITNILKAKAKNPLNGQRRRMENHSIKDHKGIPRNGGYNKANSCEKVFIRRQNVFLIGSPVSNPGDVAFSRVEKTKKRKIGTWNIQTLLQCGKLRILKLEMEKINWHVLRVSEMRWPDNGDFCSRDYRVIHIVGCIEGSPWMGGVGIVLSKKFERRVEGCTQLTGYQTEQHCAGTHQTT